MDGVYYLLDTYVVGSILFLRPCLYGKVIKTEYLPSYLV